MGAFDDQFGGEDNVPPQPTPVRASLGDPTAFPVEALRGKMRAVVGAIAAKAQVPIAMAAQSVLAAAALAAQARVNIVLPTGEVRPASLFLFTVASSGDRKSTADELALKPFRDREADMRVTFRERWHDYEIDLIAFGQAQANAKKKTDRADIREALKQAGAAPVPPLSADLIIEDPTIPAIHKMMADAPSLGLFSDEGAQFLGGWSMSEENASATGAHLSAFWDGKAIKRIRAGEKAVVSYLIDRRLSLHLMVQPGVAQKLFGNQGARDQGLMSRLLCAFPRTIRGTRLWAEPTEETQRIIQAYWDHLGQIVGAGMIFNKVEARELCLGQMVLTAEAREDFIRFNDHIERQIGPGGKLEEVADIASKLPHHAVRLAAVMAYFENAVDPKTGFQHQRAVAAGISSKTLASGIAVAQYYLSEALRLYNSGSISEDEENAADILAMCHAKGLARVGKQWLSQNAPKRARPAMVLDRALVILEQSGNFVRIKGGATIQHVEKGKEKFFREAWTVMKGEED